MHTLLRTIFLTTAIGLVLTGCASAPKPAPSGYGLLRACLDNARVCWTKSFGCRRAQLEQGAEV